MTAVLKKNGADVTVYCQDVFHYTNDELAEFLEENEFDIIGVGFLAARFKETIEPLCEIINLHKKNAWLVLGGPGSSPIPEYILQKTKADIIILGEAEKTIVELVQCKIERGNLSKVKSTAYLINGEIVVNERRQPVINLDSIPFPEWSLFPMEKYTKIKPVTPYPGSDLYYEAIRRGLLTGPEDFFNKFKNSDLVTVNFTDIPLNKYYELLFAVNKDLIIDHYMYTTKDMDAANKLIKDFYDLYFMGKTSFRGPRHYNKEKDD